MKIKIVTTIILIFSIICSILLNDNILGCITLICGLLDAYYSSIGKIYNYFFGALYFIFSGYICYQNGLYGIAFLSFTIYYLSQIEGYISWSKNKIGNVVKIRGFNLFDSIFVITFCILTSLIFGFVLSNIENQRLAFLDASSNILNLCGIILMNLRYKECWIVMLFNNSIDLIIWVINSINSSPNSLMMLLVSTGYLIINLYGIKMWYKK